MSKKSGKFLYEPLTLIELIEQRPCIWDKTINDYKDKQKKMDAWMEVYKFLIQDFEKLSCEEKLEAGKIINDKWKHIRDAFATSLKKKSGDKRVKKYIYFDELQFLLKILEKGDTESSITEREQNDEEEELREQMAKSLQDSTPIPNSCTRKRSKMSDKMDKAILKAIEVSYQPTPEIDEDTAFFKSVTPLVKKFSEDEKIEFRMGILSLIKQIKDKRYEKQIKPF